MARLYDRWPENYSVVAGVIGLGAVEAFSSELDVAEREYQTPLDDARSTQPQYAALRALTVPPTGQVQTELPASTALVECVEGDVSLAVFVLTKDDVRAKPVRAAGDAKRQRVLSGSSPGPQWVSRH